MKVGDRIRLDWMDDPDAVKVGEKGTVQAIHDLDTWTQVDVKWDNGRRLMLVIPPDGVTVIS